MAVWITSAATEKAVWNPKLWSMNMMSLSIVRDADDSDLDSTALDSWQIACAPAENAVAADHEQDVNSILSKQSTISAGSC